MAHPFWDKYIEYEERLEATDEIFKILSRIIHIPLHQYARYFERYRTIAAKRNVEELAPSVVSSRILAEIGREGQNKPPAEQERELRTRIDAYHMEIFNRTQAETTNRWTYEQEIKRPYYHVTELDDAQLSNWRKYLEFEEGEGDYERTKFLYERCLVTCANYEEFWYRYARWTLAQMDKDETVRNEEVRNIYRRACNIYVYISKPEIRLHYARFEESLGKADTAIEIHDAILVNIPDHLDTIISLVNTYRRSEGVDVALAKLRDYTKSAGYPIKGALIAEEARLVWKVKGDPDGARRILNSNQQHAVECPRFWISFLNFERTQPTSEEQEAACHQRMKTIINDVRFKTRLPPTTIAELSSSYLQYLEERGGKEAMVEWTQLDREINGPPVAAAVAAKSKPSSNGKGRGGATNGHSTTV